VDLAAGRRRSLKATGPLKEARFWSVDDPYLYDVLHAANRRRQGWDRRQQGDDRFRKTEFKGGAGKGRRLPQRRGSST